MAALSGGALPARGGAVGRLPLRPRHRSVVLVWYARRSLRRDRVGDRIGGVLVLPGQLRGSRPDLRQPRDGRGSARLPLPLGFGGAAGGRDQRDRSPITLRRNL